MKKIDIKVSGMVCSGCENRVCNALKMIDGVENVSASHENNLVEITISKDVDINILEEKIEDLGFEVIKEK